MKQKNGFTVIELLVVIFLISLIPLLFTGNFGNTSKKIEEEQSETQIALLDDAIEIYYYLSMKDNNLNYYIEDEKIISCIGIKTLISNGYILDDKYNENSFAKVQVYKGELTYTIVSNESTCEYDQISILNGNASIEQYGYNQNISTINSNTLNVDIDINFKTLIDSYFESYKDTYVMVVLDATGSMNGEAITKANTAVTNLVANLSKDTNNKYNFCTGLVAFNSTSYLEQKFTNKPFVSALMATGESSISAALTMAYNSIYNNSTNYIESECSKSADENVIVLLITDGNASGTNISNFISKGAQVITMGYGTSPDTENLINLASKTCGNNAEESCYFATNNETIITQLKDISSLIIEDAKETNYKNSKIEITLNNEIFTYDTSEGSKINNSGDLITIDINLDKYIQSNAVISIDYSFNLKYKGGTLINNDETKKINMFESVYVTFYDSEQNASKKIEIENLPQITLSKNKASAIN